MIKLESVSKTYHMGTDLTVLHEVDLHIRPNEFTAIIGPSGSGKSTLLHIMGLIHGASSGRVFIDNINTSHMDDNQRSHFRGRSVGFVFQSFHLVSHLTVLENVELPLFYQGVPAADRRERARASLAEVGMDHRLDHLPRQLSGGECQRTAMARALVGESPIILADEPTGNLDVKTGDQIIALLEKLHGKGKTLVLITHDRMIAKRTHRRIHIVDGKIQEDSAA